MLEQNPDNELPIVKCINLTYTAYGKILNYLKGIKGINRPIYSKHI